MHLYYSHKHAGVTFITSSPGYLDGEAERERNGDEDEENGEEGEEVSADPGTLVAGCKRNSGQ